MAFLKRTGGILVTAAALTAGAGLAATPALAAHGNARVATWTIKPGGSVTAKAGTTTLTDRNTGSKLSCASSSGTGKLKSGSGKTNPIGKITALGFKNCTGPLGLSFTVKTADFPWPLTALSFSSGVTTGTISKIHASLSGPSCSAVVDGTGASANNGKVKVKYSNTSGVLSTVASSGNLHAYRVNGCAGLIHSGDAVGFAGKYTVSPKQKITSP